MKEKPNELQREIARLRKSMVSEGRNFEQLEYRIDNLKSEIVSKKKLLETGGGKDIDLKKFLDDIEKQLEDITDQLYSKKSSK